MTLGELLRMVGNGVLYEQHPGGDKIVADVNKIADAVLSETKATAQDCLRVLADLEPEVRRKFLESQVEDSGKVSSDIADLVSAIRFRQNGWKTAIAVLMALNITVMVFTYAVLMYSATMHGLPLPRWADITAIIIVPGGILWVWYGVLSKENRDILAAAAGQLPAGGLAGIVASVLQRKGADAPQTPPTQPQQPTQPNPPPQPQRPPQSDTGSVDDVNDNPPPGAAQ